MLSSVRFYPIEYYSQFSTDEEGVVLGVCKDIFNKEYNSPTGDIVIAALCNAMHELHCNSLTTILADICHSPGRPGVTSNHVVRLVRMGEGLNSHYASIATEETRPAPLSIESFTPELIRPQPKAPTRKSSRKGRKRRKTAILTNSPEKALLEDEQNQRKMHKRIKSLEKDQLRRHRKERKQKSEKGRHHRTWQNSGNLQMSTSALNAYNNGRVAIKPRNLSSICNPLNRLLQKNVAWKWSPPREKAFRKLKECLGSADVLTHYDSSLPVRLACDASSLGIGAVLSHVMPDGFERPIAYASRSLSKSEKNYSQIDKKRSCHHIRCKEISSISIWQTLHIGN